MANAVVGSISIARLQFTRGEEASNLYRQVGLVGVISAIERLSKLGSKMSSQPYLGLSKLRARGSFLLS
ncbi:MAG TPA: hypothetical protein VFF31_09375 [Blastocatellia bacterium]|nr:hypothetical protein [Blastocatellia bacterium]